jgi:hypothetical protein
LNLQAIQLQYGNFRSTETRRSIISALDEESRRSFLVTASNADGTENGGKFANAAAPFDYAKIIWDVTVQAAKAPVAHERIVLFMVTLWIAIISILGFGKSIDPATRQLIVGIATNCNLIFFYGAPLSTIFSVLKSRSSATIHVPTMVSLPLLCLDRCCVVGAYSSQSL